MEGGGWGRRRCGERGRGEGQEEGGEVMERKREEKQEKKRGVGGGEKTTHWLMSTSITHRTNQYLRQALISCYSD